MLSFKPAFPLSFFMFTKRLFSSSPFSATRVVSPAYLRLLLFLLAGKVVWYSHLFKNFPQFIMITVNGLSIVNEEEVDVFLELHCFLHDPMNVGNLISGSSDFLKPSLYIWKFLVQVLPKPSLKDLEHHLTSTRDFLGGSDDRESDCNAGNMRSGPWVRKIPWRRGMASYSSILAWRNP